jgi:ABC-type uncharacterized transport system substrate-binding protein
MVGATEDPVKLGLVESFTRPGSNVTGFMLSFDQEILGKRLQLLRRCFSQTALLVVRNSLAS